MDTQNDGNAQKSIKIEEKAVGFLTTSISKQDIFERDVMQLSNFLTSHFDGAVVESAITRYIVKLPTGARSRIISNVMVSIVSSGGKIN